MQDTTAPQTAHFRWWHTMVVVLGGVVGAILIGSILVLLIYGIDETGAFDPAANFWILLPAQSASQIAVLIWVSRRWGSGSLAVDFGFEIEPKHALWLLAGPASLLVLGPASAAYRALLDIPDENPQALIDSVIALRSTSTVIAIVLTVAVIGPITEELTFRGLLLRTARDKGISAAGVTLITAAAFMIAHMGDPELLTKTGSATLFVLFLFGIILAQIRLRTGSLAASIFTHCGFNVTTLVSLLFFLEA